MKLLEKIRHMKRGKTINRILLMSIVIYSIAFTSIFFGVSISLFRMIGNIRIPDDHLLISLIPEDPMLRVSYKIPNEGISDVSNLIINLEVDICYFEMDNDSEKREHLFFKSEKVSRIDPWINYRSYIEGGSEYFDLPNLHFFWSYANLSRPFFYILNINIRGRYCLGIIPFNIIINDLNPDCPTCS